MSKHHIQTYSILVKIMYPFCIRCHLLVPTSNYKNSWFLQIYCYYVYAIRICNECRFFTYRKCYYIIRNSFETTLKMFNNKIFYKTCYITRNQGTKQYFRTAKLQNCRSIILRANIYMCKSVIHIAMCISL